MSTRTRALIIATLFHTYKHFLLLSMNLSTRVLHIITSYRPRINFLLLRPHLDRFCIDFFWADSTRLASGSARPLASLTRADWGLMRTAVETIGTPLHQYRPTTYSKATRTAMTYQVCQLRLSDNWVVRNIEN